MFKGHYYFILTISRNFVMLLLTHDNNYYQYSYVVESKYYNLECKIIRNRCKFCNFVSRKPLGLRMAYVQKTCCTKNSATQYNGL